MNSSVESASLSSPGVSHLAAESFANITGLRSWKGRTGPFAVVEMIVKVCSGSSPGRSRRSHRPANRNGSVFGSPFRGYPVLSSGTLTVRYDDLTQP